jgi:prevent-host-death family protein
MQLRNTAMTLEISIGQVKRDISDLVNKVAYQGERVILTSRGRRKAVLVSLQDYEKIRQCDQALQDRTAWLAEAQVLAERIRMRRENQEIDVNALLEADRIDLQARDVTPEQLSGKNDG